MPKLGVNIDHIATLRQARGGFEPDPISAAKICESAGIHSIVAHLREDRRHIQDADIFRLKKAVTTRLNLEMSIAPVIVQLALKVKPDQATLVPENRRELTTEGGLNVIRNFSKIKNAVQRLSAKNILVSLFIDPEERQLLAAQKTGAWAVEIHTGCYANANTRAAARSELQKIKNAVNIGLDLGLTVHVGHGLNYLNTKAVAEIRGIDEFNIGHAIIARSVFVGLKNAVQEMLHLLG